MNYYKLTSIGLLILGITRLDFEIFIAELHQQQLSGSCALHFLFLLICEQSKFYE